MNTPALKTEFDFYIANQVQLALKYRGKYVVIKDKALIGAYDSLIGAVTETSKEHKIGTFLVQLCEPGRENYTQTFHSRVVFA